MISKELNTKWNKGELTTPKYIRALNEYAMSLEAKIVELEATMSCDGCLHNRFGCDSTGKAVDCTHRSIYPCIRACDDYYEPKDTK